jgi:hypothetical protein
MIDLITSIGYVEGNKEKRTCFRRDKTATREHHSRQVTATPILSLKKEGTRVNEASRPVNYYFCMGKHPFHCHIRSVLHGTAYNNVRNGPKQA